MSNHSSFFVLKRSLRFITVIVSLLAVPFLNGSIEVRAQDGDEPQQGAPPPERPRDDEINFLRLLNLTPEQVGQLREIRQKSELEGRGFVRRLNQARRALDEAIYADNVDESIVRQRAQEVAEAQIALFRLRTMAEVQVRRVLTPEQLRRFRELRREAQARRQMERRNQRMQQPGNALNNRPRPQPGTQPRTPVDNSNNSRPVANPQQRRRNSLGRPYLKN